MLTLRNRGSIAFPFDTLWEIRREADRLLSGFGGDAVLPHNALPAEVVDAGEEIRFAIEMPGLDPADIELTLENGILTVGGEKKMQHEEGQEGGYRLLERRYGRFERSFRVPSNVSADDVGARYEHGVLHITLPKTAESRPRRIQVGGAKGSKQIESR